MKLAGSLILLVLRLTLGGIFLWAAANKLLIPSEGVSAAQVFTDAVNAFKILPEPLVIPAAFTLPWIELIAAAALVLGLWTRAAALVIALLLGTFIAAILSVLQRDMEVTCTCFGEFHLYCEGVVSVCKVYENSVLTGVALVLLVAGGGRFGLDGLLSRPGPDLRDRLAD